MSGFTGFDLPDLEDPSTEPPPALPQLPDLEVGTAPVAVRLPDLEVSQWRDRYRLETATPRTDSTPAGGYAMKNPNAHTKRADPFWDRLWQFGSQAAWASFEGVSKKSKDGSALVLPSKVIRKDRALKMVREGADRSQRIALLSVLDSWGAVTAEQMVALTGHRNLLHPDSDAVMSLFSTSLLDIGRLLNSLEAVTEAPRSAVYRARAPRGRIRRVAKGEWTSAEYLQVDAGVNDAPSLGHYDRHNIMAMELALRAAETHPEVSMIVGEKFSTSDAMFPETMVRARVKQRSEQHPVRGDGTLVLRNGLRVVIELTSTHGDRIHRKLNRWARFFTKFPLETSGTVVLFVMAPNNYMSSQDYEKEVSSMRRWMNFVLKSFPSRGPSSAAARIGLVRWTDWFPSRHEISQDFFDLSAGYRVSNWDPRPISDHDFTFDDAAAGHAVVEMAPLLAATPHWWRRGDLTPLIGTPSMRAGEPVPRESTHLVSTGVAPRVEPPSRLRVVGARRGLNSADDTVGVAPVDPLDESAADDHRTEAMDSGDAEIPTEGMGG